MSRRVLFISLSFVLLIVIVMANIFVGSYHISLSEAIGSLSGKIDDVTLSVVLTSRINAVVIALVTGAALAVAGLLLQTIFSNPLADPSVLGISSGASVGVSLCMLAMGTTQTALFVAQAFSKQLLVTIASFLGTIPILLLLLLVSKKTSNKLVILITGLMVSFINSSVVS
ncbi:MAG: iron chelate uptake ABC transporter family permease subunit, partial [Bacteroidales bacterium]|nr:iron chelate uptake ABC transporter family permease subunit [Bacteroidales bacterium]